MKPKYFLFLCLSLYILNSIFLTATVRYVSKTGTSTPPYTSWQTAATSIQLCINYSSNGDTIYVANGVYHESLIVNKYLWLIGSSMDSTVIDGTSLADITIDFQTDGGAIELFTVKGKGEGTINTMCVLLANTYVSHCKALNSRDGIGTIISSPVVNSCIISNVVQGYVCGGIDTNSYSTIKNSVITVNNHNSTGILIDGGIANISNNLVLGNDYYRGIESGLFFDAITIKLYNNIVSGFDRNIDGFADDNAIVENNISTYASERGYTINSKSDMRNNISAHNEVGVVGPTSTNSDYNLYWKNNSNTTSPVAEHDIVADPMFVNDTIPIYGGTYNYHLQKYSPAIDTGDPSILDVDGTRSDIGAYGGAFGQSYKYQDLAPRVPINLSAIVDSNYITLSWNRNTEADTAFYNVYRDTVSGFQIDSTKLISSQTDTFYVQINPHNVSKYVYKITCLDNQGNESRSSTELVVNITSVSNDEYPITINDYQLYQNYPNPFNPGTKIGYKLKERGYVKVMVYDIKGELVSVLVNKEQNAGYYEVEFVGNGLQSVPNVPGLASGIYLYRIEIIGEGRIPVFSDMKKMLMIK